jgi:hypothetical protein
VVAATSARGWPGGAGEEGPGDNTYTQVTQTGAARNARTFFDRSVRHVLK